MTSTADSRLASEDLAQIVDDVLSAFVDVSVSESPGGDDVPDSLTGRVRISGAFDGSVTCTVPRPFAAFCAARMLDLEVGAVGAEDLADTLGEVTNMIGGLVKALLPEPSVLSLPEVRPGGAPVGAPAQRLVGAADLSCLEAPVRVRVLADEG